MEPYYLKYLLKYFYRNYSDNKLLQLSIVQLTRILVYPPVIFSINVKKYNMLHFMYMCDGLSLLCGYIFE